MAGENKHITAEILLDSVNPQGDRLTTYILRGPRYLLAEVNTHRMLSRNAASSRAIPTEKLIAQIESDPVLPAYWGSNQPGMQSGQELDEPRRKLVEELWRETSRRNAEAAKALTDLGLHKQWANRFLEPTMIWTGLVSATDWRNFFALRAHKDAQPDFQVLAYRMLNAYLRSVPTKRAWGSWHMPFGDKMHEGLSIEDQIKVCSARAARLSYATFDGLINVEKDMEIYDKLMVAHPLHASPAEHPAQAVPNLWLNTDLTVEELRLDSTAVIPANTLYHMSRFRDKSYANSWPLPYDINMVHQGNYRGWTQHRKMCPRENAEPCDDELRQMLEDRPSWITLAPNGEAW